MASSSDISLALDQIHTGTIKTTTDFGCYIDIGFDTDVLMPLNQTVGNVLNKTSIVVWVYYDEASDRILASNRLFHYFPEHNQNQFHIGQALQGLVWAKTDLGYKILIENCALGLLFHSESIKPYHIGDTCQVTIKQIRQDDKIDLTQHQVGSSQRAGLARQILDDLAAHGGLSSLTDKSAAEEIADRFNVSKGAYKKALGSLFKAKKIIITKDFIKLI